jgi:hypothetical protein
LAWSRQSSSEVEVLRLETRSVIKSYGSPSILLLLTSVGPLSHLPNVSGEVLRAEIPSMLVDVREADVVNQAQIWRIEWWSTDGSSQ